jgi:D-alanyl-D-alanine carboxypeptidase/D-alanyl-D-alanine-endopeptidase (penicillin-binding protein 4)
VFTQLWRGLGGNFEGGYAHAEVKQDAEPVYTGISKPLSEVIAGTNKHSNNLLARQLLLAIAYSYFGEGTTIKDGVDSIRAWLDDKGLDMPELVIENGAGLSRQIQVSADSLGALLLHASNSQYQPEYLASFALGGMDGTMKKRLKKLELGGRARLKTGYVKGVRSLAGYVRADSGKDYLIVLLIADKKVNFSNGNVLQDTFIKWVLSKG